MSLQFFYSKLLRYLRCVAFPEEKCYTVPYILKASGLTYSEINCLSLLAVVALGVRLRKYPFAHSFDNGIGNIKKYLLLIQADNY